MANPAFTVTIRTAGSGRRHFALACTACGGEGLPEAAWELADSFEATCATCGVTGMVPLPIKEGV